MLSYDDIADAFSVREIESISASGGVALRQLREHTTASLRSERPSEHFTVSSVTYDFCPRAWVILRAHPEAARIWAESVDFADARAMLAARYSTGWIREAFADAGLLWGEYRRMGESRMGFRPDIGWRFAELSVRDDDLQLRGKVDGFLKVGAEKRILWARSTSSYGYQELTSSGIPRTHLLQATLLMHCVTKTYPFSASSSPDLRHATSDALFATRQHEGMLLVYVNRDDFRIKLISLDRNDDVVQTVIDGLVRPRIESALAGLRSHTLPACDCGRRNVVCQSASLAEQTVRYLQGDSQELAVGVDVQHTDWGVGTVIDLRTAGPSRVATVKFRTGTRTYILPDTNLRRL